MKIFLAIAAVVLVSSTALYAQTKKPVSTTLPGIQKKPQPKPTASTKTNEKSGRTSAATASTGGASAYGAWTPAFGFPKIMFRVKRGHSGINSATKKPSTLWYIQFKNTDSRYTTFRWQSFGTDAAMREYFSPLLVETDGGADDLFFNPGEADTGALTFSIPGPPTTTALISVYRVTYNKDYKHFSKREDGEPCNYCIAKPEDPYCPNSQKPVASDPTKAEVGPRLISNLRDGIASGSWEKDRGPSESYTVRITISNVHVSIEGDNLIISYTYKFDWTSDQGSQQSHGFDFSSKVPISKLWIETSGKTASTYRYKANSSILLIDARWVECSAANSFGGVATDNLRCLDIPYRIKDGGQNFEQLGELLYQYRKAK